MYHFDCLLSNISILLCSFFFFFNDTATTEIYTLSLHDALPISDCAIGKMTVCCELDLEARRRGLRSVFVPTGQTGIAIAGWGIAVDAVVSDFLAGSAERLVVEGGNAATSSGSRARARCCTPSTRA